MLPSKVDRAEIRSVHRAAFAVAIRSDIMTHRCFLLFQEKSGVLFFSNIRFSLRDFCFACISSRFSTVIHVEIALLHRFYYCWFIEPFAISAYIAVALYLYLHGLIFYSSEYDWQDQPVIFFFFRTKRNIRVFTYISFLIDFFVLFCLMCWNVCLHLWRQTLSSLLRLHFEREITRAASLQVARLFFRF